ncbi:MAG: hypothetical protein ACQETI_14650 [Halobacteriota archaeon]
MQPTGIPSLEVLSPLAVRVLEIAAEELDPERSTLEVTGYTDGDYSLRVYETRSVESHSDVDGPVFERVAIAYHRPTEWIQRRRTLESTDGRRVEDVRDLEAYPDPVLLVDHSSP